MSDSRAEPDFRPTASWERLQLRARMLRGFRRFFDDRDFLEVETPILSHDTVVDRHLDPLFLTLFSDPRRPGEGPRMWLQTSPEFAMKRLLASGGQRIYQIARCFRAGEQGTLHNPEFTLAEWYRAGDSMADGMQLLAELVQELLGVAAVHRMSYREAFEEHLGIDPHRASIAELSRLARQLEIPLPSSMSDSDRDEWLNLILTERVQPRLGQPLPLILFDYPASQAALARVRSEDPPVAERFELFVEGIELANGYHELLDSDILTTRNCAANAQRQTDGKYLLAEQSRLLSAMRHGLPACTGVALGFDRLVMLAAGARTLADVIAFPIDIA